MKKHRLFFVCGLALFMVGCQASQSSKTTEPSKASQETSVSKEDQVLNRGQWEDKLYKKLSNVIKDNGKSSSKYNESAKPYAVFDWDNTTVINDIGEATFTYQIENLDFKMTPEELDKAIRTNIQRITLKKIITIKKEILSTLIILLRISFLIILFFITNTKVLRGLRVLMK